MHFDLLIINGTVYDGTGAPGERSDVGVQGKRVTDIGDLSAATASRVIDATGLAVTPGFIDVHSHADAALLRDGQHACGIRQGVTTEIIAPDGLTLAPLSRENYLMYMHYLSGILGYASEDLDMSTYATAMSNYHNKTSCNVALFLGHGPVRLEAVGGMIDEPLTGDNWTASRTAYPRELRTGRLRIFNGPFLLPKLVLRHRRTRQHHERRQGVRTSSVDTPQEPQRGPRLRGRWRRRGDGDRSTIGRADPLGALPHATRFGRRSGIDLGTGRTGQG